LTAPRQFGFRAWRDADKPVPAEARGRWCVVSAEGLAAATRRVALARVEFLDAVGEGTGGRLYLRKGTGRAVCFVPPIAERARLEVLGSRRCPGGAALSYRPIGTAGAAARLLAAHPGLVAGLARGIGPALMKLRPEPAKARLRETLGRAIAAEASIEDYRLWSSLFDTWSPDDLHAVQGSPSLGFLVFHDGADAARRALGATIAGLRRQYGPAQPHVVVAREGWTGPQEALAALPECDYIGILQAGEVLPPHASLLARGRLAALGLPATVYADEDERPTDGGLPASPLFKPEPNRAFMVSGVLSRGLWLVRRELLADTECDAPHADGGWAEALRLDLWLRLHEIGEARVGGSRRLPFVLTHRRPDTAAAPPEALAHVVGAHLRRSGLPFEAEAAWPLRVRPRCLPRPGRVTIVVPSALRSAEAEHCIKAVLAGTRHADLELVVAVSQAGPLDAEQRAAAARIEAHGKARVLPLRAERFNFSWVNNRAVAATAGEHVLLLNDDVTPTEPDWLDAMTAHLADPAVGIVGAKLLYPGGAVQHGGVIMGLSGLCDHAHRHLGGDEAGYAGRAVLAQELSAVTGACLLVRRRVLERVGGLDERYPSAFNDVDLCLRVREAGYSVVFAPEAVLHHYELRTYGSHYAGERAEFKEVEAARMRARWAEVIAGDPFHNPNLGLSTGREWEPAFPPRFWSPRATSSQEPAPRSFPTLRASTT
jgi:GT2 family glycosyltransferase